jgi:hypothetical protein
MIVDIQMTPKNEEDFNLMYDILKYPGFKEFQNACIDNGITFQLSDPVNIYRIQSKFDDIAPDSKTLN